MNQAVFRNKKLWSDMMIRQNINNRLDKKLVDLEKSLAKGDKHRQRNKIELKELESFLVVICRDPEKEMKARDTEVYHNSLSQEIVESWIKKS